MIHKMHRLHHSFESPERGEKDIGMFVYETPDERMITHSSTINTEQLRRVRRRGKFPLLRHICAASMYLVVFIALGIGAISAETAQFNRNPANGAVTLCILENSNDPRPNIVEGQSDPANSKGICPVGYDADYRPGFTISYGEQAAAVLGLSIFAALALWRMTTRTRAMYIEFQTRRTSYDQTKVQVFPLFGFAWDTLLQKLGDELQKYPDELLGPACLSRHNIQQHLITALRHGTTLGRQLDYGVSEYLLRTKELATELALPNRPLKDELKATISQLAETWAIDAFPLIRSDYHRQFQLETETPQDKQVLEELQQQNAEHEVRALIARTMS